MLVALTFMATQKSCAKVTHATPNLSNVSISLVGEHPCSVLLQSYDDDGPTWATSGVQVPLDHRLVTLTTEHPSADLKVASPSCFGQIDLSASSRDLDLTTPHFPNVLIPDIIRSWNGGAACVKQPSVPTPVPVSPPVAKQSITHVPYQGVARAPSSAAELPFTGSKDVIQMSAFGALLVIVGGALIGLSRRLKTGS